MRFTSLGIALALTCAIPLAAHHSYDATFLRDQSTTIDGTIVKFDLRNPHSVMTVNTKDATGKNIQWQVEWVAASQLKGDGVTKFTLKTGDKVSITGAPARDESAHKLVLKKIVRASNGFSWIGRSEEAAR